MDTMRFFKILSSLLITLKERDDGNEKKQRMETEASLPCVEKAY